MGGQKAKPSSAPKEYRYYRAENSVAEDRYIRDYVRNSSIARSVLEKPFPRE
jgi:hypothetical protein